MFSGIVEGLGAIRVRDQGRLGVAAATLTDALRLGDSVAINGACLTVAEIADGGFVADVMPETLARTTLGALRPGDSVNIERSLTFGDRIGGHMVTGHIDATGTVTALRDDGNARWVTIETPSDLLTMVAEKGCVAVDGISLTVVDVFATAFTVSLIPHTLENTTAGTWMVGSLVNLEADLIARYVHSAIASGREAAVPRRVRGRSPAGAPPLGSRLALRSEPGPARLRDAPSRDRRLPSENIRESEVARQ